MGPRCSSHQCIKRMNRCCDDIDDESRHTIFTYFWSNLDWNSRKVYVRSLVDFVPVKHKTTDGGESRRKNSLADHLKANADTQKQVVKNMFLTTLGIGSGQCLG